MALRLLLALGITLLVFLVALSVRTYARRRTAAALGQHLPPTLAGRVPRGAAAIVYFHGTHCGACVQQAGILERLARDYGVHVVDVDAAAEADLASVCGVMTVPSTVVVDGMRRINAVNLGFRSATVLAAQLQVQRTLRTSA